MSERVSVSYGSLIRGNVNFRYLWSGQIVSLLGDWFNLIASATLVAELTQSGIAVGGLFVARMLAQLRDAGSPGGSNSPGADLVYGVPDLSGEPLLRRAGSILNRSIFRLFLGVPRRVAVTSYRAFRSSLASRLADQATRRPAIPPNVSTVLLSEHPKLGVVHYTLPVNRVSRHSNRALIIGILLLVGWWAPVGLIRRVMRRHRPARERVSR